LNFKPLIKSCYTRTDPATETESIGLPAYAQLAQVFAEPLRQLYRDTRLRAVNRDSSVYRDYPIWQLYRDPKLSAVNRDYPIWQFYRDTKLSAIYRDFIWTKKIASIYRDCAKTHASAGRCRQLIKPPAVGGNMCPKYKTPSSYN
jgi:hypothetical protein